MRPFKPLLLAALCAATLALPAFALADGAISDSTQPSGPASQSSARPYGHHRHGMMSMLRNLGLTEAQQGQIKTYIANYKQAHPEGSQPDKAAREQLRNQILAVLTPEQRVKLDQERQQWRAQHTPRPTPSPSA